MNAPLPKTITDLFVTVPAVTLPTGLSVPAFQVSKYACSKGADGKLTIDPELKPWSNINFAEAKQACADAGYELERESQRLALAFLIASEPRNWTGGTVGEEKLFQGHRKASWSESAKPGNFTPADPDERRVFFLPDGQEIYDVAGNIWSWIFDDVQGDKNGLIGKKFSKDTPSLVIPYPGEDRGQGYCYARAGTDWSGGALLRGGCWRSDSYAGLFRLYGVWPGYRDDSVGFRCTKTIGH